MPRTSSCYNKHETICLLLRLEELRSTTCSSQAVALHATRGTWSGRNRRHSYSVSLSMRGLQCMPVIKLMPTPSLLQWRECICSCNTHECGCRTQDKISWLLPKIPHNATQDVICLFLMPAKSIVWQSCPHTNLDIMISRGVGGIGKSKPPY